MSVLIISNINNRSDVDFFTSSHTSHHSYKLHGNMTFILGTNSSEYDPSKIEGGFTFDGNGHTINIQSATSEEVTKFAGLFDILDGEVKNLIVKVHNVSLKIECGWINTAHGGDQFIKNKCIIKNCSTYGPINTRNGGIVGSGVGYQASAEIVDCTSYGEIMGDNASGIVGQYAGKDGSCTIKGCVSYGNMIGMNCSGIVNSNAGLNGSCTIKNCKSFGNMNEKESSGIAGSSVGESGSCKIMDCESSGQMNFINCSGIVGRTAGHNGLCQIINCKSSGDMYADECSGIANVDAGNGGKCQITNCASTGVIIGDYCGGIVSSFAGVNGLCQIINCTSSGDILGDFSGGIASDHCGSSLGEIPASTIIVNCSTSGNLRGGLGGGIVGPYAGSDGGSCEIANCSSSGDLLGELCGGIVGPFAGTMGYCSISNSTTSGLITTFNSGGIAAGNAYTLNVTDDCAKIQIINKIKKLIAYHLAIILSYINSGIDIGRVVNANGSSLRENKFNQINDMVDCSNGILFIQYCMSTATNDLDPEFFQGRITGRYTEDAPCIYVSETSYYKADDSDDPYADSVVIEHCNHPTKTIEGLKMFNDKDDVKHNEYDGIQAVALALALDDDDVDKDYGVDIQKICFEKNNVHPLSILSKCKTDTQRQESYDCHVVLKLTFKCQPSHKKIRLWIPNTNSHKSYNIFKEDNEKKCFDKLGKLKLKNADCELISNVHQSNLWEYCFPESCKAKHTYYIIPSHHQEFHC